MIKPGNYALRGERMAKVSTNSLKRLAKEIKKQRGARKAYSFYLNAKQVQKFKRFCDKNEIARSHAVAALISQVTGK